MGYKEFDRVRLDDGPSFGVGIDTKSKTEFTAVFDGMGGLETVINFDLVQITKNSIKFQTQPNRKGTVYAKTVGQIERNKQIENLLNNIDEVSVNSDMAAC